MSDWLPAYFAHLDKVTAAVAIVVYLCHLAINWDSPAKISIALGKAISSSGIPNGAAFLICTFFPDYILKMQGAVAAFLIGGLAMISITFMDVWQSSKQASS